MNFLSQVLRGIFRTHTVLQGIRFSLSIWTSVFQTRTIFQCTRKKRMPRKTVRVRKTDARPARSGKGKELNCSVYIILSTFTKNQIQLYENRKAYFWGNNYFYKPKL